MCFVVFVLGLTEWQHPADSHVVPECGGVLSPYPVREPILGLFARPVAVRQQFGGICRPAYSVSPVGCAIGVGLSPRLRNTSR